MGYWFLIVMHCCLVTRKYGLYNANSLECLEVFFVIQLWWTLWWSIQMTSSGLIQQPPSCWEYYLLLTPSMFLTGNHTQAGRCLWQGYVFPGSACSQWHTISSHLSLEKLKILLNTKPPMRVGWASLITSLCLILPFSYMYRDIF